MFCPTCGSEAGVVDSRSGRYYQRRRRKCSNDHRFTTVELVIDSATMEMRVPLFAMRPSGQLLPMSMAMMDRVGDVEPGEIEIATAESEVDDGEE